MMAAPFIRNNSGPMLLCLRSTTCFMFGLPLPISCPNGS